MDPTTPIKAPSQFDPNRANLRRFRLEQSKEAMKQISEQKARIALQQLSEEKARIALAQVSKEHEDMRNRSQSSPTPPRPDLPKEVLPLRKTPPAQELSALEKEMPPLRKTPPAQELLSLEKEVLAQRKTPPAQQNPVLQNVKPNVPMEVKNLKGSPKSRKIRGVFDTLKGFLDPETKYALRIIKESFEGGRVQSCLASDLKIEMANLINSIGEKHANDWPKGSISIQKLTSDQVFDIFIKEGPIPKVLNNIHSAREVIKKKLDELAKAKTPDLLLEKTKIPELLLDFDSLLDELCAIASKKDIGQLDEFLERLENIPKYFKEPIEKVMGGPETLLWCQEWLGAKGIRNIQLALETQQITSIEFTTKLQKKCPKGWLEDTFDSIGVKMDHPLDRIPLSAWESILKDGFRSLTINGASVSSKKAKDILAPIMAKLQPENKDFSREIEAFENGKDFFASKILKATTSQSSMPICPYVKTLFPLLEKDGLYVQGPTWISTATDCVIQIESLDAFSVEKTFKLDLYKKQIIPYSIGDMTIQFSHKWENNKWFKHCAITGFNFGAKATKELKDQFYQAID